MLYEDTDNKAILICVHIDKNSNLEKKFFILNVKKF
jgi:hypothetical protein